MLEIHFKYSIFCCVVLRKIIVLGENSSLRIKQLFGSRVIYFAVASNYIRFILITFAQLRQFLKHGFAPRRHHTWLNQMQSVDNEVGSPNQKTKLTEIWRNQINFKERLKSMAIHY